MANTISIIIQAEDKASKQVRKFGEDVRSAGNASQEASGKVFKLNDHIGALAGVAVSAGLATRGLFNYMSQSVTAAGQLDSALIGLSSISDAYGQNTVKARKAAQELASDGLMPVTDAATGLKNLLATGFSLDQAVKLMRRFKDSAAFGRQSALSFGEAIASATEGIKNGNSVLVDNAGVTKNLSVMLTEAGYAAGDMSKAADDAGVRQAIFNGIMRETNAQVGDAAKYSENAAGQQQKWSAQTLELQQRIGTALQPALIGLLTAVTPMIEAIAGWVEKNPELAAGIGITALAVGGLITTAASLGLAISGLGPIFSLFAATSKASVAGVQTTFGLLKTAVTSPLAMPAIAVAAAIGALVAVKNAADEARAAVDNAARVKAANEQEEIRMIKLTRERYQRGEISKEVYDKQMKILANASGTNSFQGGWTLVGEHGPEPVYLPQGAQITPNYRARQDTPAGPQGGGGGGATVVIQNYNNYHPNDSDRILRDIGFQLELAS